MNLPQNINFGNHSWYILVEQLLIKLENSANFRNTPLEIFAKPVNLR